jgi:hypothetical protein
VNKRPETIEEVNKVMEYLEKSNHVSPILLTTADGTQSVGFEVWSDWDREVWTLSTAFFELLDTADIIVPSAYAEYRAADLLANRARDDYYKAMDYKDKKMDTWLKDPDQ